MPTRPVKAGAVLKLLTINIDRWDRFGKLADRYQVSRTDALDRLIAKALEEEVIPGFVKKAVVQNVTK